MAQNIEVFTGENESGVEEFSFTRIENLHHEHVMVGREITQSIFLKSDAIVYTARLKQGAINFNSPEAVKNKDDYRRNKLDFFVPKDDAGKRLSFDNMKNHRWLVICKDNNGNRTVMGDKGRGCLFAYSFGQGNTSKANGYSCAFSYDSHESLPIIKETVNNVTVPKTDQEAQDDFDPFG